MIKTHSDDPDVEDAAARAYGIIQQVLAGLPPAATFDYGGHILKLDEYDLCTRCTKPIAEAQQAHQKLTERAGHEQDPVVKEHLEHAIDLLEAEAHAAKIRAELHNGRGSERIVNSLLGFIHDRGVRDTYEHSHHGGN